MKLKPGLFQLIVIVMTASLVASCTKTSEARRSDCDPQKTAQQANNCDRSFSGTHGSGIFPHGSSGSRVNSSSDSASRSGRGGFGSFGRGGHAGG